MAITNGLGPIKRVNRFTDDVAGRMNKANVKPEFRFVSSPVVSLQDFAISGKSAPMATIRTGYPVLSDAVVDCGPCGLFQLVPFGVRASLLRKFGKNIRSFRSLSLTPAVVGFVFEVVGTGFLDRFRLRSVPSARFSCLRSSFFGSRHSIASKFVPARPAIRTNSVVATLILGELRERLRSARKLTFLAPANSWFHAISFNGDHHYCTTNGGYSS